MSIHKDISGSIEAVAVPSDSDANSTENQKVPWWSYIWDYDPTRTRTERLFLQRLDVYLLTISCFGYFIKNLDQTNISNAYVSGMKEDLKMNGNQLNLIDVAWTSGYVVGQLPSQLLLTKVRPSIWIPSCELVWTILTFCIAASTTANHVIAIRFFVGLTESIFYPAALFILGSWYKPSELGKRTGIFHASSAVAGMFSGYLQAAVYKGLNGVQGRAGWQWLFIMDGIISLPICIAGFFLIPDLPENTRAFYINADDSALARKRMADIGRAPRTKLGWGILRRIFTRWHVYAFLVLYIVFINSSSSTSVVPMSLWMKSKGWSVSQINVISTGLSAVQLVTTVGFAILSDFLRNRGVVMAMAAFLGLFSYICLTIWNIPDGLKWFSFLMTRGAVVYGPLSMSWANEVTGGDAEERAMVLGIMNAGGYAVNAWLPLLTYPATDAPQFKKGFAWSTACYVAQILMVVVITLLWRWERRKKGRLEEQVVREE